jgi:P27 family predicted phage terminase small subunit
LRDGPTVANSRGTPIAHPALKTSRDALAAFRLLAQAFGLDPSSRAKINTPERPEPNEWDTL